jgi:hypothetical protein
MNKSTNCVDLIADLDEANPPCNAVDVDIIALPPECDVRMGRFGQEVTSAKNLPAFG